MSGSSLSTRQAMATGCSRHRRCRMPTAASAYLPDHPPQTRAAFQPWLDKAEASDDPLFFTVIDKRQRQDRRAPDADAHRCGLWRHRDRQHLLGAAGRASARRDRGALSCSPAMSSTSSAIGASSGNATTQPAVEACRGAFRLQASKASSASIWWSRAKTATPPGTRSSTRNGRRCAQPIEAWLDPANFGPDGRAEATPGRAAGRAAQAARHDA